MACSVPIARFVRLAALAACLAGSALPATGAADPLGLLDQLTDSVGQSEGLTLRTLRSDGPELRPEWQRDPADPFERDPANPFRLDDAPERPRGVVASSNRFGFALDLGGPDERSAGIAWSPNETVSIGAGGGLSHGIEGRLYLRLRF